MCAAALQQAQLDGTSLDIQASLDRVAQTGGKTAELRMAEAVRGTGFCLGDESAVGKVDAFGNGNKAVALGRIYALDIGEELIHVKVELRQIHQIGTGAEAGAEGGGSGEPSGMTATARIKAEFVIKNGSEYSLHKESFLKMS